MLDKIEFYHKISTENYIFKSEDNVPVGKLEEKNTSLKSLKKGVESGVGSGSISQRYVSGDPDPQKNVTDPQHWLFGPPGSADPDPLPEAWIRGSRSTPKCHGSATLLLTRQCCIATSVGGILNFYVYSINLPSL
jgi:hypothetical protein